MLPSDSHIHSRAGRSLSPHAHPDHWSLLHTPAHTQDLPIRDIAGRRPIRPTSQYRSHSLIDIINEHTFLCTVHLQVYSRQTEGKKERQSTNHSHFAGLLSADEQSCHSDHHGDEEQACTDALDHTAHRLCRARRHMTFTRPHQEPRSTSSEKVCHKGRQI